MTHAPLKSLAPSELINTCGKIILPESENTALSGKADAFLGLKQERFIHALALGIESEDPFANIFVTGLSGTAGFDTVSWHIRKIIEEKEKNLGEGKNIKRKLKPALSDWVYVYNFVNPRSPIPIPFPQGAGKNFKKKIYTLIKHLQRAISENLMGFETMIKRGESQNK